MNGFLMNAPYIAAIFGATASLAMIGVMYLRDLRLKKQLYQFACEETDAALLSADRALKNGATPPEIRYALLCMLEMVADPDIGRDFVRHFAKSQSSRRKRPGSKNPVSEAIDKLHASHPELAADVHKALMGMILALPLIHAEKVEVTKITALEYAGEGATNPSGVFDRAAKALSSFDGRSNKPPSGGFAAA